MTPTLFRRATTLALAAVPVLLLAVSIASGADTSFTGRVFRADGVSPRSGVVVTLFDAQNQQRWVSQPTNSEGTFSIEAAPVGTYGLIADTSAGSFLAASTIQLAPGVNRPDRRFRERASAAGRRSTSARSQPPPPSSRSRLAGGRRSRRCDSTSPPSHRRPIRASALRGQGTAG